MALIERIAAATAVRDGVRLGIGDDAAVLDCGVVAAHDMLVQDVHFRWSTSSPEDVGHRALAVNLSDLAAMGAAPLAALVGLGLPADVPVETVDGLYRGLEALAAATGCTVAGGDTTRAAQTVLGVTVLGRMAPGVAPVTRAGARPGDALYVTGRLGASAAGLALLEGAVPVPPGAETPALVGAHRRPVPRLREGAQLAARGAHAMMDCSNGLAIDLRRLAVASGVRAVLDLDLVPVAPGVDAVARALDVDPARFAATGGEDYELIVALPAGMRVPGVPLVPVGHVEDGVPGLAVVRSGRPVQLDRLGWDHDVG